MAYELKHKITLEDVEKLNKALEGTGWTVGELYVDAGMLDLDIEAIGIEANSTPASSSEKKEKLFNLKHQLNEKRTLIWRNGRNEN